MLKLDIGVVCLRISLLFPAVKKKYDNLGAGLPSVSQFKVTKVFSGYEAPTTKSVVIETSSGTSENVFKCKIYSVYHTYKMIYV